MKKLIVLFSVLFSLAITAQPKGKEPKMQPTLTPGYYCSFKGDSVKGEIQSNPINGEADFYHGFSFKAKGVGKVVAISPKKARAYGFDGRHFTLLTIDGAEVYLEYIVKGRLNFLEYKFAGSKGGSPAIESVFFIQDTKADEASKDLREARKISQKFYKKDIKPYMKDQPATWENLDKFTFSKEAIANAIREFNKYYDTEPVKPEIDTEKVSDEQKEESE